MGTNTTQEDQLDPSIKPSPPPPTSQQSLDEKEGHLPGAGAEVKDVVAKLMVPITIFNAAYSGSILIFTISNKSNGFAPVAAWLSWFCAIVPVLYAIGFLDEVAQQLSPRQMKAWKVSIPLSIGFGALALVTRNFT